MHYVIIQKGQRPPIWHSQTSLNSQLHWWSDWMCIGKQSRSRSQHTFVFMQPKMMVLMVIRWQQYWLTFTECLLSSRDCPEWSMSVNSLNYSNMPARKLLSSLLISRKCGPTSWAHTVSDGSAAQTLKSGLKVNVFNHTLCYSVSTYFNLPKSEHLKEIMAVKT
jgi:hypothetical protein